MYLSDLSLLQFKNFDDASLKFSEKINCFVGDNGVGKTNLMDAVHYLSMCKSYFNSIDSQNIMHNKDFFVVQGEFIRDEQHDMIYCGMKRQGGKQFKRNRKDYEKLSDHIGLFPVVMVSPSDSALITEGSEERRRFMDGVISQYDKAYLDNLIKYNRILLQRNKVLKETGGNKVSEDFLMVYDYQLSTLGQRIHAKRQDFIQELIPVFNHFYEYISGGNEPISLLYNSQLNDMSLSDLLLQARQRDLMVQHTTVGIHKDDLELQLNGYPIKKNGSQGQQKTYLVALKLSQFNFIYKATQTRPIMLFDDVFDKFDHSRVTRILQLVSENHFGQVFITDTDRQRLESLLAETAINHRLFIVNQGKITQTA
jgi:DNA replication and repair protein RecF